MTLAALAAAVFVCTPVAVWDGDGPIWCREGPRIRIEHIAAREIDGTCRPGSPCPASSGLEARNALVGILGGAKGTMSTGHIIVRHSAMTCRSPGMSYNRVVASCTLEDGRDLARAMVATGTVLSWNYRNR
jgi:endonuclease YncB( thermonuclease family)